MITIRNINIMCNRLEDVEKLAIYGTGVTAKEVATKLLNKNQFQKVQCAFDRVLNPQNSTFMGVPIYSREKIGEHLDEITGLIIATQSFEDVLAALTQIYPNLNSHNIYYMYCRYLNIEQYKNH